MPHITIENLKSVSSLEFEIPQNGVHILTGINGSGKTTLLTCLQRIADRNAFQRHFRTSSNNQFDNFQTSKITFSNRNLSLSYSYRNSRWAPTPKSSNLLSTIGYAAAIMVSSSSDRFYVQNEELNTRGITLATSFIKDSMVNIFNDNKFNELRRKKLDGKGRGNGRWNYGYLMPLGVQRGQNRYYSEKNFSLGEILILNALNQIENTPSNSLILIDEIELALHPKVQVRFLRFLEDFAALRNSTVIISTHSASLIKAAKSLIYLERNSASGTVNVEYDCFPAIALQNVAVVEEVEPDVVFFVEDVFGRFVLEELIKYYRRNLLIGRCPIYKILPVGGWGETIRLAENSSGYLINNNVQVYAWLDLDVRPQLAAIQANPNRTPKEQEQLNLYNANLARVRFLPITPELGIVNLLNDNPNNHFQPLQDLFNSVFDIQQIIQDETRRPGIAYPNNPRKEAKVRLDYYIERIRVATNRDYNYVRILLAEYFANNFCPQNHQLLQQMFNPIFQ
jgi:ABC-type lipoprotein export system ATPase subunit